MRAARETVAVQPAELWTLPESGVDSLVSRRRRQPSRHTSRSPSTINRPLMNSRLLCGLLLSSLALGGCAINQTVKPVQRFESTQICIVDNPAVRQGFVETYKRVLAEKGY